MKRKFITTLLLIVTLLGMISGAAFALGEKEDFDTYSEYDSYGHIDLDGDTATWTDISAADDRQYAYKDYGVGSIEDTGVYTFSFYWDKCENFAYTPLFAMSDTIGDDFYDMVEDRTDTGLTWIQLGYAGGYYCVSACHKEHGAASVRGDGYPNIIKNISLDTLYYCKATMTNTGGDYGYGQLFVEVYIDEEMTYRVVNIEVDKRETINYQYIIVASSLHYTSGDYESSGYIKDLVIENGARAPAIETCDNATWYYDPYVGYYKATLTANLTDAGGGQCWAGFYYRNATDGDNWMVCALDGYQSEGIKTYDIWTPSKDAGDTYEFRAFAENPYGSDNGTLYNFQLIESEAVLPTIQTLGWPIDYEADNVTIYGHILYDGGEPCDGKFYYRQTGNATWIESDVTHDLETDDLWHFTVTSVPEMTEYQFKASANNSAGSVNGTIGTFKLWNVDPPVFTTNAPTDTGHDSVTMSGTVVSDGGDTEMCWAWFEFRQVGADKWQTTQRKRVITGDEIQISVSGLTPSTQYEYRIVGHNWLYAYGEEFTDYYGDTVTFYTDAVNGIPIMEITETGYLNDFSFYVFAEVEYDGDLPVTVWLEYRPQGQETWISNAETIISYDVHEGQYVTHYILNVDYGQVYQVRAVGQNDTGKGYSSATEYFFVAPGDTTTQEPNEFVKGLNALLGKIGLNNPGGKLIAVIGTMIIVFLVIVLAPGKQYAELAKFTVPVGLGIDCLIFVLGIVIGYVPTLMTVGVIIACAGTVAVFAIKMFRGSSHAGA